MYVSKRIFIVPLLFAIQPFLFLYSKNIGMFSFSDTIPAMIITLTATIFLFIIIKLIVNDYKKTILLLSFFLLFFFSYGHFFQAVINITKQYMESKLLMAVLTTAGFILLIPFVAIVVVSIYIVYIVKMKQNLNALIKFINITAIILIAVPSAQIVLYQARTYEKNNFLEENSTTSADLNALFYSGDPKDLPDVYYIILDGYARADILKEIYKYDNSDFISCLERNGFFVAGKSRSNYSQTAFSLASSLNMQYLDDLRKNLGENSQDRLPLKKMIFFSKVSNNFKKIGYSYVHINSPYILLTGVNPNADLNLNPTQSLNEFEYLFLSTTALRPFLKGGLEKLIDQRQTDVHADFTLNTLTLLQDTIPKIKKPTFTFAHVVSPHPPFVFGPNGEKINRGVFFLPSDGDHWIERYKYGTREDYIEQYKNQMVFLNKKLCKTVEKILENSSIPPVVILQADHGPGAFLKWEDPESSNLKERTSIFNAYRLPQNGKALLYDSISPVNSFRIVFNALFGGNFKLLEDKSYHSTWSKPYRFIEIPK